MLCCGIKTINAYTLIEEIRLDSHQNHLINDVIGVHQKN